MKRFLSSRYSSWVYNVTWIMIIIGGFHNKNCVFSQTACSKGFFDCGFGKCIHEHKVCNSQKDCDNERDEIGCECITFGYFYCYGSSECIYNEQACDGLLDCADGSDESNCPSTASPNIESSEKFPFYSEHSSENFTSNSDLTLSSENFSDISLKPEFKLTSRSTSQSEPYYEFSNDSASTLELLTNLVDSTSTDLQSPTQYTLPSSPTAEQSGNQLNITTLPSELTSQQMLSSVTQTTPTTQTTETTTKSTLFSSSLQSIGSMTSLPDVSSQESKLPLSTMQQKIISTELIAASSLPPPTTKTSLSSLTTAAITTSPQLITISKLTTKSTKSITTPPSSTKKYITSEDTTTSVTTSTPPLKTTSKLISKSTKVMTTPASKTTKSKSGKTTKTTKITKTTPSPTTLKPTSKTAKKPTKTSKPSSTTVKLTTKQVIKPTTTTGTTKPTPPTSTTIQKIPNPAVIKTSKPTFPNQRQNKQGQLGKNKDKSSQNSEPSKKQIRPLLKCNKAGMDAPYKWRSHKYCPCKKYVTGRLCDRCDKQSFYLNEKNKDGCLRCFCMNVSRTCDSSSFKREKIIVKKFVCEDEESNNNVTSNQKERKKKEVSCNLPDQFLGDKISSYGGVLKFRTRIRLKLPIKLYLKSNNWTIEHEVLKIPKKKKQFTFKIKFLENEWKFQIPNSYESPIPNSQEGSISRSDLLVSLSDIQSMKLEVRIWKKRRKNIIFNKISMDIARNISTVGKGALEIENCTCPIGYTGSSCHLCAPGFEKKKVQSSNPDDLYFVCHNKTKLHKQYEEPKEAMDKLTSAYKIIFMLKTSRETNVLSFNLTEDFLKKKKKKPYELQMLRNNSVTYLYPYKQTIKGDFN